MAYAVQWGSAAERCFIFELRNFAELFRLFLFRLLCQAAHRVLFSAPNIRFSA